MNLFRPHQGNRSGSECPPTINVDLKSVSKEIVDIFLLETYNKQVA